MTIDLVQNRQLTHFFVLVSTGCQVNRCAKFSGKTSNTVNMVSMLMGHQNGIDVLGHQTQARQSSDSFFNGEAKINDYTGTAIIDQGCVTLAAASQGSESHWHALRS